MIDFLIFYVVGGLLCSLIACRNEYETNEGGKTALDYLCLGFFWFVFWLPMLVSMGFVAALCFLESIEIKKRPK